MELNTASEVISLARKFEEDGVRYYENLAQRYVKDGETWLAFARENKSNVQQIERAYYGVITDAIEGCFCFAINPEEYTLDTKLTENTSYPEVLGKAARMEEKIMKFYSDAVEQSKSLLPDVPRVFSRVAKKRGDRIAKLGTLLSDQG